MQTLCVSYTQGIWWFRVADQKVLFKAEIRQLISHGKPCRLKDEDFSTRCLGRIQRQGPLADETGLWLQGLQVPAPQGLRPAVNGYEKTSVNVLYYGHEFSSTEEEPY